MNYAIRLFAAILTLGLTGCGGENFDGVYRTNDANGKHVILNIKNREAAVFLLDRASAEISNIVKFSAEYKSEKMLLDSTKDNTRFVFKRSIDERSLECLNCDARSFLPAKWAFVESKPLDVELMIKEQESKRLAVARETERLRAEAMKLKIFDGDWVIRRNYKDDFLTIMSISHEKGVTQWSFNYSSAAKIFERDRSFEVLGSKLVLMMGGPSKNYVLSEDGKQIRCTGCQPEEYWIKADPNKVKDLDYTRSLAGNPQEYQK